MNKMLKKTLIILGAILSIYILYNIALMILAMCLNQKPMPVVEVPIELKQLEKEIIEETNDSETNFHPIPEHEIENCNANIYIYIYIKNDTINASEESLNEYIKTVSNRVNKALISKECYKKLTISTSSENDKKLNSYNHHFEFPIE